MARVVALLLSFAAAGYAATKLFARADATAVLTWFVAAVLLHDFVVLPLYSAADRLVARRLGPGGINYVRVPAVVGGVLGLVYFPSILRLNAAAYRHATGLSPDVYLGRWLAICGVLFAASALVGLTRRCRRAARSRATARAAPRARPARGSAPPRRPPRR
jgi:hypothetical protein